MRSSASSITGAGSVEEYIARQTPRGLGSYIMRLFMDEFSIEYPEESGTEVTLVKMLPAEDSKPWPG